MIEKKDIGPIGEEIAARFLKKSGFYILDRNSQKPWGEIDIVAREKPGRVLLRVLKKIIQKPTYIGYILYNISREIHCIHFFEVKTRLQNVARENRSDPTELFTREKAVKFDRIVRSYVLSNGIVVYRQHLISVVLNDHKKSAKVQIIYDAH